MKKTRYNLVRNQPMPSNAHFGRLLEKWLGYPFNAIEALGYYLLVKPSNVLFSYLDRLSYRLEGTWLYRVLQHTLFPLILIVTLIIGFKLAEDGISLASIGALSLVLIVYGLFCIPIERLMPWRREWNRGGNDIPVDLMMYYSAIIWNVLAQFVVGSILLLGFLEQLKPIGHDYWPVFLPAVVQVFLFILLKDFLRYWYHRAMHQVPMLWRWHAVHHSSKRLYWLNGLRVHPLEVMTQVALFAIPLALLQPPAEIVLVSVFMSLSIGIFQHTNVNVKLGFWEYIFSIGDNHRWHHYNTKGIGDCNYGGEFILWDILFGTFYHPKDKTPPTTIGMAAAPNYPQTMAGLMIAPFMPDQTVFGPQAETKTSEQTKGNLAG